MSISSPTLVVDAAEALAAIREIRELAHQLGRTRHQLVSALVGYDLTGHWAFIGFPTCAHWIASELDVGTGTAREWLRVGHALHSLEIVNSAFADGRLSYAKVRELTRVAVDHPDKQSELVDLAARETANDLGRALAAWTSRFEESEVRDRRHHRQRSLTWRVEPDGMAVMTTRLPIHQMATITTAIDTWIVTTKSDCCVPAGTPSSRSVLGTEKRPTLQQQRADALVGVVTHGGIAVETEVVVHVRGDGCTMDDGSPITDSAVARLLPTSFVRLLIHDSERMPINASGRHRHPTDRQKAVVKERDRRCVGCGAAIFLDHHHEPPFEVSKRTVVDELELRCGSCHRRRHRDEN